MLETVLLGKDEEFLPCFIQIKTRLLGGGHAVIAETAAFFRGDQSPFDGIWWQVLHEELGR